MIPDAWGRKFECDGAAVAEATVEPGSIHFAAKAYFFLIMLSAQAERTIAINSDRSMIGFAPSGCIEIVPENSELFSRWEHTKYSLLIAITEKRLLNLAGSEWGEALPEFYLPKLGVVDQKALTIASLIRQELLYNGLKREESLESLITFFGIHALRTYTSLSSKQDRHSFGGLTPAARKRVIDFIHANLSEKLTIEKLASIAELSPSYFARAFRQSFGQTPHELVLTTRLQTARSMILASNVSLAEISQVTGFSSNSHMSTAMKKFFGKNPRQIRHSK